MSSNIDKLNKDKRGWRTRKNRKGRCCISARIEGLPIFDDIYDKMCRGWRGRKLADYIHDKGCLRDLRREFLDAELCKYRKYNISAADKLADFVPGYLMKAEEEVEKGLEELDELHKLYKMQMDRIEIDREKEEKIGKLFNNTHKEIEACLAILQASAKLKQDLGLTKKKLGDLDIESRYILEVHDKYPSDGFDAVLSNPMSRRKILNIAQKLITGRPEVLDDDCNNVLDFIPASEDIEE